MRKCWKLIDALKDGQPQMLRQGQRWLPRESLEHVMDYQYDCLIGEEKKQTK